MSVPYAVPHRSTPLSEFSCPRKSTLGPSVQHEVTKDSEDGDAYTCTCGTSFRWQDQTHYEVVNDESKAD